jgi:hypothetical protein
MLPVRKFAVSILASFCIGPQPAGACATQRVYANVIHPFLLGTNYGPSRSRQRACLATRARIA